MTLSGRPLLDNRPDQVLFVDRSNEMDRVRRALNQGLSCFVVGERGCGKTSFLRALMFHARQFDDPGDVDPGDRLLPELIYVRGSGAGSASELLVRAADALSQRAGDPPSVRSDGAAVSDAAASELIAVLGERAAGGRVVMVLDDVPAGGGNALFGVLRDELWSIDLRWLVTVATADSGALLRPPADAFFESQIQLAPLPVGASIEILRRRMGEVPDQLLEEAARLGGGNPRRLLDVARQFSGDYSQWSTFVSAAADRDKALAVLGRSAQMLAVELEALGGSSASDDRLLSRIGWTRPRAVQVLTQMEKAGLVTATRQKTGQGRPRKVYAVVSPAQFVQRQVDAGGPEQQVGDREPTATLEPTA